MPPAISMNPAAWRSISVDALGRRSRTRDDAFLADDETQAVWRVVGRDGAAVPELEADIEAKSLKHRGQQRPDGLDPRFTVLFRRHEFHPSRQARRPHAGRRSRPSPPERIGAFPETDCGAHDVFFMAGSALCARWWRFVGHRIGRRRPECLVRRAAASRLRPAVRCWRPSWWPGCRRPTPPAWPIPRR